MSVVHVPGTVDVSLFRTHRRDPVELVLALEVSDLVISVGVAALPGRASSNSRVLGAGISHVSDLVLFAGIWMG